jgi:hypothetical protein
VPGQALLAESGQDLGVQPVCVGTEYGHEVRDRHLLELAGEEGLQPQQVRRVPRSEHRQRAEQADPGPSRTRFALRAVKAGELVRAGRGEHVAFAAHQLLDDALGQLQVGDRPRQLTERLLDVLPGENQRGVSPAHQIRLRLLDHPVQREGEPETFTIPFKKPKDGELSIDQQSCNAVHGALRCLGERANSLLKTTYKALRRQRGCPWSISAIATAALVLLHHEHARTTRPNRR